jgi:hypothetical protein
VSCDMHVRTDLWLLQAIFSDPPGHALLTCRGRCEGPLVFSALPLQSDRSRQLQSWPLNEREGRTTHLGIQGGEDVWRAVAHRSAGWLGSSAGFPYSQQYGRLYTPGSQLPQQASRGARARVRWAGQVASPAPGARAWLPAVVTGHAHVQSHAGWAAPAHAVLTEALPVLEEALLLLHAHHSVGLGHGHVRRLGQVADALEHAHAAGAADGHDDGVHLPIVEWLSHAALGQAAGTQRQNAHATHLRAQPSRAPRASCGGGHHVLRARVCDTRPARSDELGRATSRAP